MNTPVSDQARRLTMTREIRPGVMEVRFDDDLFRYLSPAAYYEAFKRDILSNILQDPPVIQKKSRLRSVMDSRLFQGLLRLRWRATE